MNEATIKRRMVKSIQEAMGYARRIEDQFGVGIMDTILIPVGLPVFFAEVKIIRGPTFGPTPRQFEELRRVKFAATPNDHAIPIMIGWRDNTYYFHPPAENIDPRDCFSVTTTEMSFNDQLCQYWYSTRK